MVSSLMESLCLFLNISYLTGNNKTAQEILSRLEKNVPGLVMVAMRRISLERRQGNHAEAERLFQEYLEKTTSNKCRTFFAIKYTRYLQKVRIFIFIFNYLNYFKVLYKCLHIYI